MVSSGKHHKHQSVRHFGLIVRKGMIEITWPYDVTVYENSTQRTTGPAFSNFLCLGDKLRFR